MGAAVTGAPGHTIYFGQVLATNVHGTTVGCNIEITTSTPNATRRIRYGQYITCTDQAISGQGIAHLGEVVPTPLKPLQSGQFFGVTGDNVLRGSPPQYFTRTLEYQHEQVFAFFTVNITSGKWFTQPATNGGTVECTPTGTSTMTCALATIPFAFVAADRATCDNGDICEQTAAAPSYLTAEVPDTDTEGWPTFDTALGFTPTYAVSSSEQNVRFTPTTSDPVTATAAANFVTNCRTILFADRTGRERAEAIYSIRCSKPATSCNFINISFQWFNKLAGNAVTPKKTKRSAYGRLTMARTDGTTLGVAGGRYVNAEAQLECFFDGYGKAYGAFFDTTRTGLFQGTV